MSSHYFHLWAVASMCVENTHVRQMQLTEIGSHGQRLLATSHVGVVGAGGLGAPLITYLAAAGVGRLTVWEHDVLSASNLNRQFFYAPHEIGQPKALLLQEKLAQLYPHVHCEAKAEKVTTQSLEQCSASYFVLCVDNWATRSLVNDHVMKQGVSLIDGGVDGFYGYVYGFSATNTQAPCLACLNVHAQEKDASMPIAALGAVCGVIGSLQASLCLQMLLGMPHPYDGAILQYDAKQGDLEKIPMVQNPLCPWHKK